MRAGNVELRFFADGEPEDSVGKSLLHHLVAAEGLRENGLADSAHALHGGEGDVAVGGFGEERVAQGLEKLRAVDEVLGQGGSVVVADQ